MSDTSSTKDGVPAPFGGQDVVAGPHHSHADSSPILSNAEIADPLASLAQLLSAQKENPYTVKAYRRAAAKIRTLSESLYELVQDEADLTQYAGIGEANRRRDPGGHPDRNAAETGNIARAGQPGAREHQRVSAA